MDKSDQLIPEWPSRERDTLKLHAFYARSVAVMDDCDELMPDGAA